MTASEPTGGTSDGGERKGSRRAAILIALVVMVCVVAIAGVRTDRRVTHDAAFCTSSCHHETKHATPDLHANGHAEVECQQCHTMSRGAGLKLWWQAFTGSQRHEPHGKTDAKTCSGCHEKRPAEWRLIDNTAGHREHRGRKNVDCLSCHGSGIHVTEAPEKTCLKCHEEQRLHKATTKGAETCLSCHGYTVTPKNVREPTTVVCEKCHAGQAELASSVNVSNGRQLKDVNKGVLHGGVACQLCHNAHGKKPKPLQDGQPVCARCHQFDMFQAGPVPVKGPEEHRKCEGCHKPHAPLKTAMQNCVACHEKNAKGLVAAGATVPGKTTAVKHTSCASCHLPHSWRAERSGCMQCHDDKAQLLLTRSPPQHDACTKCHEVHGPPPTGAVCLKCHAKTKGNHVALAPERHKNCTSCHNPHAPLPQDTRTACPKCHTAEVTQVLRDGPAGHEEGTCFGCHQPHNDPRPPPSACAKCHGERAKIVATASPPKHRVCMSCHTQHKFKITEPKTACAKCHGQMFQGEKVPHDRDCKGCHTIHGSPGVARTTCLGCHDKVAAVFKAPNEKHNVCKSCHTPHTPKSAALVRCRECHEQKAAVAAKWPPQSAHAQACNNCHEQHAAKNKKACAECHAPEATSAVGSKHQCMQCHPPHKEPPGAGPAWWARCNECHSNKVESVKQRGPTHSECKNCHKPHRFAIPACTSCHTDMASKGLHAAATHAANCNKCHDPHVKSEPVRQQCLSCHTNRTNHEPDAQKCQACHQFK